jgi:hemolysin III
MSLSTTQGRAQTRGEEIANALSHFAALAGAIAALPFLVMAASGGAGVVGASLFGATAIVLYLASTLYHAARPGRFKAWMNRLDHAAIYLFIAGSYMPFLLGVLYGAWGWTMFGVVWCAATLGVVAKLLNLLKHPLWSTGLYIAMGWVALLAAVPLVRHMAPLGLAWLVAGGLAYTLGALVFHFDHRMRYAHFVWHLFVVAGSGCHLMAALRQWPLAA